jgi:hypothetical protein
LPKAVATLIRAASQHSKIRFKNADAIGFPAGDELAKFSPSLAISAHLHRSLFNRTF